MEPRADTTNSATEQLAANNNSSSSSSSTPATTLPVEQEVNSILLFPEAIFDLSLDLQNKQVEENKKKAKLAHQAELARMSRKRKKAEKAGLEHRVEELEHRVEELEQENDQLKQQNAQLKQQKAPPNKEAHDTQQTEHKHPTNTQEEKGKLEAFIRESIGRNLLIGQALLTVMQTLKQHEDDALLLIQSTTLAANLGSATDLTGASSTTNNPLNDPSTIQTPSLAPQQQSQQLFGQTSSSFFSSSSTASSGNPVIHRTNSSTSTTNNNSSIAAQPVSNEPLFSPSQQPSLSTGTNSTQGNIFLSPPPFSPSSSNNVPSTDQTAPPNNFNTSFAVHQPPPEQFLTTAQGQEPLKMGPSS